MSKKNPSKVAKISIAFLKELETIDDLRLTNKVENAKTVRELTPAEKTRMIINADSWLPLKEELATKPRRKK